MRKCFAISSTWIILFWLTGCGSSSLRETSSDLDISKSIRTAALTRQAFEQAEMPLDWLDEKVAKETRNQLIKVNAAMESQAATLNELGNSVRTEFRRQFEPLERVEQIDLQVGIRHQAFLEQMPEDLEIILQNGTADVTKSQGPTTYHLCLNYVVPEGPAAMVRFRLPIQGRRGTPVPYLGVRDEFGNEAVVINFNSRPNPHHSYELFMYRAVNQIGVLYEDRFYSTHLNRLGDSLYIFFHMNDESRVVIEEVRIPLGNN